MPVLNLYKRAMGESGLIKGVQGYKNREIQPKFVGQACRIIRKVPPTTVRGLLEGTRVGRDHSGELLGMVSVIC